MARWQRALVTGASAGIGEAFARELATRGTDVVLVARRKERLNEIADELGDRYGIEAEVLAVDLTDNERLLAVEARLEDEDAPIDLLVNNAGGGPPGPGPFRAHDRDAVERQALLNVFQVLRLTHAAIQGMAERGSGNVINVSSGVSFYPLPGGATYAASKAFVNSLGQALDVEVAQMGVHVTTVVPGFTRTDAPGRGGFSEDNIPKFLWSDPEEVARAALEGAAKGERMVFPRWPDRANRTLGRHLPNVMMRRATRVRNLRVES